MRSRTSSTAAKTAALVISLTATALVASSFANADPLESSSAPPMVSPLALDLIEGVTPPDVQFDGVHYRPRAYRDWGRHNDSQSATQIHLGFFKPDGDAPSRFLIGIRGGPMVDPHVQLGLGVDWTHKTDNSSSIEHRSVGPGGTVITTQQNLSEATTDLVPLMAFVQISADDNLSVIPYLGGSGGYEVMWLHADDFQTGNHFDATYGGWGWQVWGGAAIPLSGRTRVTGEVFVNGGQLGRDVTDPTGATLRETVSADGAGVRAGLAWGF